MFHRLEKRARFTAIVAVLAAGAALIGLACGGSSSESGGTPSAAAPAGSGGTVTFDFTMGDNFFDLNGTHNPTLDVPAGATVEINLTNKGSAIHNLRFAGADNQYNTNDDTVSDPQLVASGQTGTVKFTVPTKPGTYDFHCDFHPADSKGEIAVK